MTSWSREAASPNTENPNRKFDRSDLDSLYEALYPVRAKYMSFGLQIGLDIDKLRSIEMHFYRSSECLREVLSARLKQEPTLTCANIVPALQSATVREPRLADEFESLFGDKSVTQFQFCTDKDAQQRIDEAMESGSLQQRNVVGVITGLMGAGKTTLLCRLFGIGPPKLYTSTGVADQSFRGLLHHTLCLSASTWSCLSHKDIRELLSPLIRAGMKESDVEDLATRILHDIDNPAVSQPLVIQGSSLPTPLYHKPLQSSPSCQEMVPLVKAATVEHLPKELLLELVHMIDTGGQPELMEVMPSLIHNANLAMVLVNLKYGLNECPPVNYHEKGVAYTRKSPSRYTSREVVLKLVSTLHGKKFLKEQFRILIVATHRDCVEGDLETRVEALNSELRSLLLPVFENELILFEYPNKIAFVLDLKHPNDSDKGALELLRTQVRESAVEKPIQMPMSFFVLEQDLVKYSENVAKRDILSFEECKQVGAQLKMSSEMVVAALVHFHRQNTFLYYRQVLPNHIFIKPQVALDIINSIIRFSYTSPQCFSGKFARLLKDGIITEELLSHNQISPHFKKGFYEVKDAIKLFCHTFTIAPLDHKDDTASGADQAKREYLMMCLKPAIPDHELHHYLPQSSETDPLVVKFSSGCVPLGCFGSTVSCLLLKYRWEVIRKSDGSPKCLAHNIASLHVPDLLVDVTLVDFNQHLEIHISCDVSIHKLPSNTCNLVLTTVFGAIEKVFDIMCLDRDQIDISPAVVCPCRKMEEKHFATFKKCGDNYFLRCSQSTTEPDEKQCLWLGDAKDNSRPTLPQLMRLQIPEKVGPHYRKFGTLLLQDDTGAQIASITMSCHYQPVDIVNDILKKWLQKEPTPVTWDNLIRVLRDCDLKQLAEYVQRNHRELVMY